MTNDFEKENGGLEEERAEDELRENDGVKMHAGSDDIIIENTSLPEKAETSSLPDVFSYGNDDLQKKLRGSGKTTSIKSQRKFIAIALAVVLVLGGVYAILQATVLKEMLAPKETIDPWGDPIGPNNRLFVIPQYTREAIQEVIINNQYGTFRYYRAEDNKLYFDGAEYLSYNPELTSQLAVDTYYMLSKTHFMEYDEDLSVYGLTKDTCSATVRVTMLDSTTYQKKTYTLTIGNKLLTEGGYYAMVEGKDAIFVLDTTLEKTYLADIKSFFIAQLAPNLDQSLYYNVTNFTIEKNGEKFVEIIHLSDEEKKAGAYSSSHQMIYPGEFAASLTNYSSTVLQSLISPVGEKVVEYDLLKYVTSGSSEDAEKLTSILSKYNFFDENGKYYHKLSYYFDEDETDDKKGITPVLYISKLTDGYYYVFSIMFDIVAAVPQEAMQWIDKDLIYYVDSALFDLFINDVASIEVKTASAEAKFDLSYINEGKKDDLTVLCNGTKIDTYNFRQFYMALLYMSIAGYADNSAGVEASASVKVTSRDGKVRDYVFYDIATRRSYFTINGEGYFYISRDYVKKLDSDLVKVINGETVVGKEW